MLRITTWASLPADTWVVRCSCSARAAPVGSRWALRQSPCPSRNPRTGHKASGCSVQVVHIHAHARRCEAGARDVLVEEMLRRFLAPEHPQGTAQSQEYTWRYFLLAEDVGQCRTALPVQGVRRCLPDAAESCMAWMTSVAEPSSKSGVIGRSQAYGIYELRSTRQLVTS